MRKEQRLCWWRLLWLCEQLLLNSGLWLWLRVRLWWGHTLNGALSSNRARQWGHGPQMDAH